MTIAGFFDLKEKKTFSVANTEDADDENAWCSQTARDASDAAELYAERLNEEPSGDDETFSVSVKDTDGSIKRFEVRASLSWSYYAAEEEEVP